MISIIGIYHQPPGGLLMTMLAKVFMSGRSQAVRLPKELRFEGTEVIARRFGNGAATRWISCTANGKRANNP